MDSSAIITKIFGMFGSDVIPILFILGIFTGLNIVIMWLMHILNNSSKGFQL